MCSVEEASNARRSLRGEHPRKPIRQDGAGDQVLCGGFASCYNDAMKRHTTTITLIAILIPSVCFAWGRDGHRIVGNIAAKYLTPQAAAAVKDLCHVRNVG